jgi:hypothetical protein
MRRYNTIRVVGCCVALVAMWICPIQLSAQDSGSSIDHESGFYYQIQKGDTLWDLSDRFFDSPWLWPELWEENSQIPNPHWIYPGERIRLFQQKGSDKFTFQRPAAAGPVVQPTPPPQVAEEKPVETQPYYFYAPIDQVGFIRKAPVVPVGSIFAVKDNKVLISANDIVYIKPNPDQTTPLMPGSRYTAYRTMQPTPDKKTNARFGTQYYLLGTVEIIQVEPRFTTAKVIAAHRAIRPDDLIMPYQARSSRIPLAASPQGLQGHIITGEEHQELIGDHHIAFIDKGAQDQILPGQRYAIFYQRQERLGATARESVELPAVDHGALIVLHAEQQTATVLITKSFRDINAGDTFRTIE